MDVFTEKSNRSIPTVSKVLRKPDLRKRISVENGGWVYYPNGKGDNWSFRFKEMMDFINKEFYQKFFRREWSMNYTYIVNPETGEILFDLFHDLITQNIRAIKLIAKKLNAVLR